MAVGQTADVTIAAVGADVTGTVTAIAPTTTGSTSGNGGVRIPVTVSLSDVPATVRAGMTADVTITIDSADERADRPGRGPPRQRPATTRSWSWTLTARPPPSRSRSGS